MAVDLPNSGSVTFSSLPADADNNAALQSYLRLLLTQLQQAHSQQFDNAQAIAEQVGNVVDLTSGVSGILPTVNGGTASSANANAANGVVVLDGSTKLPAADGSQLTSLPHQLPSGGTTGQALEKNSNSDYDLKWATLITPALQLIEKRPVTTSNSESFTVAEGKKYKFIMAVKKNSTGQIYITLNTNRGNIYNYFMIGSGATHNLTSAETLIKISHLASIVDTKQFFLVFELEVGICVANQANLNFQYTTENLSVSGGANAYVGSAISTLEIQTFAADTFTGTITQFELVDY